MLAESISNRKPSRGINPPATARHAGARRQAKAVVCGAQLRELFNATFMYAEDHRGWLPYMGSYYKSTKFAHPRADHAWPTAIAPYVQESWELMEKLRKVTWSEARDAMRDACA